MMNSDDSHISSFILYCRPEKQQSVEQGLSAVEHVELHGKDGNGKFVLVTEAPHQGIILDRIEQINQLDGVIDVSMVYHQIMPNSELGDHVQEEEASQLIKAKDAIQFCEKEMSAISS
jgi:nitrate reductase NapD